MCTDCLAKLGVVIHQVQEIQLFSYYRCGASLQSTASKPAIENKGDKYKKVQSIYKWFNF